MDLAFSAEEEQFRTEVREFLDANLTAELRAAGRLQTSVYSDHEASLHYQAVHDDVDIISRGGKLTRRLANSNWKGHSVRRRRGHASA